ncbi:hypothetical protein RQP46_007990 [Phenoliferia psychrophenolica]
MSPSRIVVVIGATGQQGGSVARTLLEDGRFPVRAFTRRPDSESALALAKAGAEVVQGDLNNIADLERAFKGAYAIYALTDAWSAAKGGVDEVTQGKNLADAAVRAGVKKFFFSCGFRIDPKFGPSPMCHDKNVIEDYCQGLPELEVTSIWPMFYHTNWIQCMPPRLAADGRTVEFAYPIYTKDMEFPVLDTDNDMGPAILGLLTSPKLDTDYNGGSLIVASESLTLPQMAAIYSKVTGQEAHHVFLPTGDYDFVDGRGDWTSMARSLAVDTNVWKFWSSGPYRKGVADPLADVMEISTPTKPTTWEAWLRRTGFNVQDPAWREKMIKTTWE